MVASEIANQQYKHAGALGEVSKIGKGFVAPPPPKLRDIKTKGLSNCLTQLLRTTVHIEATHKRQFLRLIFDLKQGSDHLLPCPQVTQQSINKRSISLPVLCG